MSRLRQGYGVAGRLGYDAVLRLARIASALSSVSLLPISSHFPLI